MFDLHCHLLPGIDDGAESDAVALAMARALSADGVSVVACTPHILPGLYLNSGPQIRAAVDRLQGLIASEGIPLRLLPGADNHVVPDFVAGLRSGRLLTLGDSRYVLVEPPHHVVPPRMEELFFGIMVAGYVPILTHPERLKWISAQYDVVVRLAQAGVWMQVTAGSLTGDFGKNARYWAERMLDEGHVHVIATDAHDVARRPPILARGRDAAARIVGDVEAENLVFTRPRGVLSDAAPAEMPPPPGAGEGSRELARPYGAQAAAAGGERSMPSVVGRLRRFFA